MRSLSATFKVNGTKVPGNLKFEVIKHYKTCCSMSRMRRLSATFKVKGTKVPGNLKFVVLKY